MSDKKQRFLRDAWRLAWPFFNSEEKWVARGLILAVTALSLLSVAINVRINFWQKDFYNALQEYDHPEFLKQLLIFSALAFSLIATAVYQIYLGQLLQIRWRRWMTERYLKAWLSARAYYRIQLTSDGTDNPDQRISDDLERFTRQFLSLTVGKAGLLSSVVTFFSFLSILWTLSGPLTVPLGSFGEIEIPGYLVWIALIYAVGGTLLTMKIGRPLVPLAFNQQRYEADFRFALVRLRENAESVAFYRGEDREHATFSERFQRLMANFRAVIWRQKLVNWFGLSYGQLAIIFPFIVASPRYFQKEFQFGELMQVTDTFVQLQTALSFIVDNYNDIAEFQSVVQRLTTFEDKAREIATHADEPQPIAVDHEGGGLAVEDLKLDLPSGAPLQSGIALDVAPQSAMLISGPTGSGKSTLLRAAASLWPFGRGRIRVGDGNVLFLPQKPYLPLGTLRNALLYPQAAGGQGDESLDEALKAVGLGDLASELDTEDNWSQRLSLGEQQRLAFARLLLTRPSMIFLDEATSALDEPSEAQLYKMLREAPWHPTIVSVGHRSTLREFHDKVFELAPAA